MNKNKDQDIKHGEREREREREINLEYLRAASGDDDGRAATGDGSNNWRW